MKISIVTLFPKMIEGFFNESIIKRAQDKKLVEIEFVQLRDFAHDNHKSVDDKPYGGGAGMVLKVDVLKRALDSVILNSVQDPDEMLKQVQHDSSGDERLPVASPFWHCPGRYRRRRLTYLPDEHFDGHIAFALSGLDGDVRL